LVLDAGIAALTPVARSTAEDDLQDNLSDRRSSSSIASEVRIISDPPTKAGDRPATPIKMIKVTIQGD
jgi:hypothetical protein